jgi:hypothetical protein
VIRAKGLSDAGAIDDFSLNPPTTDEWVRKAIPFRRFGKIVNNALDQLDCWKIDGSWYDAAGEDRTADVNENYNGPDCDIFSAYCAISVEETRHVLVIYEPDFNATGHPNAPNSVHFVGYFPKDGLTSDPNRTVSTPEQNMGIETSCLCSVEPDLPGGTV